MLGRWQPWHDGHTELFKRAHQLTGQVMVQVRDVQGVDDNPFSYSDAATNIIRGLKDAGYEVGKDFEVMRVPNITNISYGRGVGYTFTEHDLGEQIHKISATNIRKEMREKGEL